MLSRLHAAKLLKLRHITKGYTLFFIEVVIFNHTKNRGVRSATAIKWEMQTVSGAECGVEPQQQAAVQIKRGHRLLWSACRGVLLAKRSAGGRVHRGELASVDATRPEAQACGQVTAPSQPPRCFGLCLCHRLPWRWSAALGAVPPASWAGGSPIGAIGLRRPSGALSATALRRSKGSGAVANRVGLGRRPRGFAKIRAIRPK